MVIVRYQSFAANTVRVHRFQSVASPPKGDGKLLSKVTRVASRAPFGSFFFRIGGVLHPPFNRWQRVVRYSRCTNFCRPLVGWSFGALAQACKQSSRRFTVLFRPSLSVVFAHAEQHEPGEFGNVRIPIGEIRNVER